MAIWTNSDAFHSVNVFSGYKCARATRTSFVIGIFSTFLKPVIAQLNLSFAHSRLAKRQSQHFKCLCTFNLIFYTKLNTVPLIHFFRIEKTLPRAHQNTTTTTFLAVKNKLTIQNGWVLSTYITRIEHT